MEMEALEEALANFSFTCGAPLQDLELPEKLENVFIHDLICEDLHVVEKLYYTAKQPLNCV